MPLALATPATPFQALQGRANRAVFDRLANAVALVAGVEVAVLFDQPYAAPFGESLDTMAPVCAMPTLDALAVQRGDSIVIGGVPYMVERIEPDGTGVSRLTLYAAA